MRSELIYPQKFGVLATRNAGLIGDVFSSREQALAWLETAASGTTARPASLRRAALPAIPRPIASISAWRSFSQPRKGED